MIDHLLCVVHAPFVGRRRGTAALPQAAPKPSHGRKTSVTIASSVDKSRLPPGMSSLEEGSEQSDPSAAVVTALGSSSADKSEQAINWYMSDILSHRLGSVSSAGPGGVHMRGGWSALLLPHSLRFLSGRHRLLVLLLLLLLLSLYRW